MPSLGANAQFRFPTEGRAGARRRNREDGSDLLTLARLLRDAGFESTAFHIERSFDAVARDLLLAIHEREQILQVLDDPPTTALVQLRAVLVREHVGRGGDGLV